jgi:predicted ATPase
MPNLSPEGRRRKTLAILAEWLLRLGRRQPVVLLVEDLHWIGRSTLEILGTVLEQVPTAPILAPRGSRSSSDYDHPIGNR